MIKGFINKNKWDIICYSIVLFFFLDLNIIYWGKLGNFLLDGGREAYIPLAILRGEILYKDILNIYGSLGYQINAVLYFLFGSSFKVLFWAGIVNALIIITSIYYLARQYLSEILSMVSCIFILVFCCFSVGESVNYIFPYSYATYYALTFFLLSLIFLLKYLKGVDKNIYALLSFFALGTSIACKIEFILFLFILIFSIIFIKPLKFRYWIDSIFLLFLAPVLSFGILCTQGLNIYDINNFIIFINKYANVDSMKFYLKTSGVYPRTYMNHSLEFAQGIISFIVFNSFLYCLFQTIKNQNKNKLMHVLLIICSLISFYLILLSSNFSEYKLAYYMQNGVEPWVVVGFFGWIGWSSLLILFVQLFFYFKDKDKKTEDIFFIILIISSILTNRSLFFLDANLYGNFSFPLSFLVNLIFWVKYIPRYFGLIDKDSWQKTSIIIFMFLSLFIGFNYYKFNFNSGNIRARLFSLKTNKGDIYLPKQIGYCLQEALKYINSYAPEKSKIVMWPEGPILSFITDRTTMSNFHSLITPEVEAISEDKIIKEISVESPDYIMINNIDTFYYKDCYFGFDYAKKIMSFINNKYSLVKVVDNNVSDFEIKIYKKKQ